MDILNSVNRLNLTKSEFLTIANSPGKPVIVPLYISLPLPDISPVELYDRICRDLSEKPGTHVPGFLLESMEGDKKTATYSFIGVSPSLRVTIDKSVRISGDQKVLELIAPPGGSDAVETVKEILGNFKSCISPVPRFSGGFVGYFSYDLVYSLLPVSGEKRLFSRIKGPIGEFMLSVECIAFDHEDKVLFLIRNAIIPGGKDPGDVYDTELTAILRLKAKVDMLCSDFTLTSEGHAFVAESCPGPAGKSEQLTSADKISSDDSPVKNGFIRTVEKIKDYIRQGEVIQTVISRREEYPFGGDPFRLYRALREVNPGPYMYYLDFTDHVVVGASPEMLVRVEGRSVTTVPIAGTRRRGKDRAEDRALESDLLADRKEQAEHVMLVDLARNDIGSVCRYGSVRVPQFMEIGKYSHVQHIISTVTGELRDGFDCFDAFRACFPAGTVTGAPKIRAIELIDSLEPDPRGLYAGAVGYIGFDQRLEFAIAIRTAVIRDGIASVQVGAGIVADSVPSREFVETNEKAAAMRTAIFAAGDSV